MAKIQKTNAMRILDSAKINYNVITYETEDNKNDGISVAFKIGKDTKVVYKTLVTQSIDKEFGVFIIPVEEELDLKKAAMAMGSKSIEMIHMKDLLKVTGYIKGGCSPVGMKKTYKTFFDSSVLSIENIIVSGGKVGIQIEVGRSDLIQFLNAAIVDLIK